MTIEVLYALLQKSSGISTDTRKIGKDNLFFALKGENFNGNLFAQQALEKGASHAVVDEKHFPAGEKIILVNDVLKTLQQLANHHRHQLRTKFIAISGSNGKTTTKELIRCVLEQAFKTFATQGNLNNHIGVPLTLLSISSDTQFAVIELGANHLKETELLCSIVEPDFGLITNNGKDHLEGYGSIEGVRKGNGELFDYLRENDGTVFVCTEQEDLMKMSDGMIRVMYGSDAGSDCFGMLTEAYLFLKIQINHQTVIETQLIGKYNFDNVMAAICIGKYFDIPNAKIKTAIEAYTPSNNRSQLIKRGSNTFLLDAYNANPSSVNAALDNFFALPAENKIVILGDMAELGKASNAEHEAVIAKLKDRKLNKVLLVGDEFKKADAANSFLHFKNVTELKNWFTNQKFENTFFLLKASRIIALEKLLE